MRRVRARAEVAVVERGHVRGDQLALAFRQRVRAAQQRLGEIVEGLCGVRPVLQQAPDARVLPLVEAEVDVRHEDHGGAPRPRWKWPGVRRSPGSAAGTGRAYASHMDRQKEFVLRTLEERDIRFVRLWFTDVLGYLKSVAIAPAELEGAFEEGIGFDGSSIEGFARVSESDTVARPDPSTFQVLPWTTSSGKHHSARMFCDITMPDGSPSWADSRHVLRRQLAKASELGFSCYVHPEIEFFLLQPGLYDGSEPVPADNGGYFDQAVHDAAPNFRRHAIDALEQMGISVEFSHHEGAPGQQEIDLRYADALSMADNVMTFRYVVKEVALGDGVKASFMPKPFAEYPGSAMHTHMSLFEGEN